MKAVLTVFLLVLMWLSASSCSHERSKLASIDDACELLLKEDVETLLDARAAEPETSKSNYGDSEFKTCVYRSGQGPDAVVLRIAIRGSDAPSVGARDQLFETMQEVLGTLHQLERLDGFMDGAIWQGSVGDFFIFDGKDYMQLSIRKVDGVVSRSTVEAVAKNMIKRL